MEVKAEVEVARDEIAVEEAKIQVAQKELAEDQAREEGGVPPEYQGIWDKYQGDPIEIVKAYKALQGELTRLKQGRAEPATEQETKQETEQVAEQVTEQETEQVAEPEPEKAPEEKLPKALQEPGKLEAMLKLVQGDDPAQYKAIAQWAANNISEDRKQLYNKALKEGDETLAVSAWRGIQYEYQQQHGYEPKLVGGKQSAPSVQGFRSQGEVLAAMSDERYDPSGNKYDEGYHRSVMRKLAASPGVLEPQ